MASVMRSSLSFDESFLAWIWDVLLRLKLHRCCIIFCVFALFSNQKIDYDFARISSWLSHKIMEKSVFFRSQLITSDNPEARDKPNPFQDVNDGTVLPQANKAKVAQSCYVTIMMTNVGHR